MAVVEDSWRIGRFTLDAVGHRIHLDGDDIGADAQQAATLAQLARAYPAIVDKNTLIESVWGGAYVTEAALQKTISTLRRLLQEHDPDRSYVQTRHRRGYQLAIEPMSLERSASDDASAIESPMPIPAPNGERSRLAFWLGGSLFALGLLGWSLSPNIESAHSDDAQLALAPEPEIQLDPIFDGPLEAEDSESLLRIIGEAEHRDRELGQAAAEQLRLRSEANGDPSLHARALRHLGVFSVHAGQGDRALDQLQQALAAARLAEDTTIEAEVLHSLGFAHLRLGGGQSRRAGEWAQQALALRRERADPVAIGQTLNLLTAVHLRLGELDTARALIAEMHTLAAGTDQADLAINALLADAEIAYNEGGEARPLLEQALAQARSGGQAALAAAAAQRLAAQHSIAHDHGQARAYLQQARSHLRSIGTTSDLAVLSYNEATFAERAGDRVQALALYRRALDESAQRIPATMRVYAWLAIDRLDSGPGAEQARMAGYREAVVLNEPLPLAYALSARADQALIENDPLAAQALLDQARAHLGTATGHEIEVHLRRKAAWVALVAGDAARASKAISALQSQLEQRESGDTSAVIDSLLEALAALEAGDDDALDRFRATQVRHADVSLPQADGFGLASLYGNWPWLAGAGLALLLLGRILPRPRTPVPR